MSTLSTFLKYEVWFFVVGLALIVVFQILTGKINVKGLLHETSSDHDFSPGRLQLLVITVAGALSYLSLVLGSPESGRFPDIPNELLLVLGGSNLFYLAGKFYSFFGDRLDSLLSRARTERGR